MTSANLGRLHAAVVAASLNYASIAIAYLNTVDDVTPRMEEVPALGRHTNSILDEMGSGGTEAVARPRSHRIV
jgi:polysaccharide pyruvyl transferase WcaK-like protein